LILINLVDIHIFQSFVIKKKVSKYSVLAYIAANGPAVCFSRRNPTTAPAESWYLRASGPQNCHGARRFGACFAVMVQILLHTGAIAVQVYRSRELITVTKLVGFPGAVSRYNLIEARNCQGKRILIEGRCACPVQNHYKFVLRAGAKQKP
jgi:hypothetical protein